MNTKIPSRKLITARTVFQLTLLVIAITILAIWLFGLGQHRTIFINSILSTSIISVAFFVFLLIGLYNGFKLKDDIGRITDRLKRPVTDFSIPGVGGELFAVGDGIGGIILSLLLWIFVTLLISLFLWLFGAVLWTGIVVFVAMLYWIFFRAFRLVFKNSKKCRGDLVMSVGFAFMYTSLYMCWVYAIILISHYLI